MLLALLRNKLPIRGNQENGVEVAEGIQIWNREDPLTASVFERLTYIPFQLSWAMLSRAVVPPKDPQWPQIPPTIEPSYEFWPSLRPGEGGFNAVRVEPDVVVQFGNEVVLFEMKHHGEQSAVQWREQVLAARNRWRECNVTLVATGGWSPEDHGARVKELATILPHTQPRVFCLRWQDLQREVQKELKERPEAHVRAILNDIQAALAYWGYPPHQPLSTLVETVRKTLGDQTMRADALSAWDPAGKRAKNAPLEVPTLMPPTSPEPNRGTPIAEPPDPERKMTTSPEELAIALREVRTAFRLVYAYQRRLSDLYAEIDTVLSANSLQFDRWGPCFNNRPPTEKTRFYARHLWAWDMLPGYAPSSEWTEKNTKGGVFRRVVIEALADTGRLSPGPASEPDPLQFDDEEKCRSILRIGLWTTTTLQPDWRQAWDRIVSTRPNWGVRATVEINGATYTHDYMEVDLANLVNPGAVEKELLEPLKRWANNPLGE